jgi:hypothetical protein
MGIGGICRGFGRLRRGDSFFVLLDIFATLDKSKKPAFAQPSVILAQGFAGVSDSMLSACKTVLACKPVRALQGGIQFVSGSTTP